MKFHFRLKRVLKFVELKEREKKMEVAAALRELEEVKTQIKRVEQDTSDLLAQSNTLDAHDIICLKFRDEKIHLNRKKIFDFKKIETEKTKAFEDKKQEMSRLSMRKKALETHREKKRQEFSVEESRRNQTRLDEAYRMSKIGKN